MAISTGSLPVNLGQMPLGRRRTKAAAVAAAALASPATQRLSSSTPVHNPHAELSAFQQWVGLPQTGEADDVTVARIVAESGNRHIAASRYRTSNLQEMLVKIGFAPDRSELDSRTLGESTTSAVRQFQEHQGLTVDGLVGTQTLGALQEAALAARLSTKRQAYLLQRRIQRALKIRGLDVTIDVQELKSRSIGASTQAAVRALQASLGLPVTGTVDTKTFMRINSVAASRRPPASRVAKPDPSNLAVVKRQLRLNMANQHVPTLQRALAFLGHPPASKELKSSRFGPSTRQSVIAFQAAHGLAQTGAADRATLKALNRQLVAAAPVSAPLSYKIRGSVRDASWVGRSKVTVELSTDPPVGTSTVLATRITLANGFYDMPYNVPLDPASSKPLAPLALKVRFIEPGGATIGTKRFRDPTPMTWMNFTEGPYPFQGQSLHEAQLAAIAAAGCPDVTALSETGARPDVSRVALAAGLNQDDLMRLILAARAAHVLAGRLDAPFCFAFLAQGLPVNLPENLLAWTDHWTLIDQLVQLTASGIAMTEPTLAADTFDAALAQNLVPIALAARRDAVLAELTAARQRFALDNPSLPGNGTLRTILQRSTVPATAYDAVADVFVATGGLGPKFWSTLTDAPNPYGGAAAVASLQRTADIGTVAKNFAPMVQALEQRLGGTASRNLGKLTPEDWTELVTAVGEVPAGIAGTDDDARRAAYARTMAAQAQRLFPTAALTATVKRTGAGDLAHINQIEQLLDEHPDLDLRVSNIDTFAAQNSITIDADTRSELKVLQRVHRIAATTDAGAALLANGLHSSVQIMSMSRDTFVAKLVDSGVEPTQAQSIRATAEFQWTQVLHRLSELRSEVQSTMPAALAPHVITQEVRDEALSDLPDLELLFGPLDACDCPLCASIHGPAAYLADLLRFLDSHDASAGGGTVLGVLRARRPDVTTLKLDCANTDTPLPFIDITNELLESVFPGSAANVDLQTTLPADELRAAPEHQDSSVYDLLRVSDIPMSSAYDLWADQIRTLLQHLGVPRWRLMEMLGPDQAVDVAAEYFGISVHEAALITTAQEAPDDQHRFWGFDATRTSIPVLELLECANLSYLEFLLLLQSAFITPAGDPKVHLTRPADSADLAQQTIDAMTPKVLDRLHRLLRLARHAPWDSWELDLLLQADRIGGGQLDGPALEALHGAAQLSDRLGIGAEQLATWFGTLPVNGHPSATDPTLLSAASPSRYTVTFLSRAFSGTPDPAFDPQPDGSDLTDHRAAVCAALGTTDTALTALLARTGTDNDLTTLSRLLAWVELARALHLDVTELLLASDLLLPMVADPFASPADLMAFLDLFDVLRGSGAAVAEQDYLVNARPESPLAPPDNAVTTVLGALREALRIDQGSNPERVVVTALAAPLRLPPTQVFALVGLRDATGTLLDAFTDPALLNRGADGTYSQPDLTPVAFPRLIDAYLRLVKMATVVALLGLNDDDLTWLLAHGDAAGLRLADLPVAAPPAAPLVTSWVRLLRWASVRRDLLSVSQIVSAGPGGSPSVPTNSPDDLSAAATSGRPLAAVRDLATTLTGIDTATLALLDGNDPTRYADPVFGRRLVAIASTVKRLGVNAGTAAVWATRDRNAGPSERDVATSVTAATKAKYERATWLSVLTPLQDEWREHKRDALVAFLLEHAARTEPVTVSVDGKDYPNPRRWTSSDDLVRYLCADVENSACALTSRVQHAIGTTQMFMQSALLNLMQPWVVITTEEKADQSAPNSWHQWETMKSYAVYAGNLLLWLYPENTIARLPEMRGDKSPFFKEFEQDLLAGEITSERCEAAFHTYLEKVDAVANLDVVGVHHEIDDDHPWDDLPPSVNVLHVVGRTRGEPYTYYYRTYDLNAADWSPWEKIDTDITGDQVLPVVYNRMLHLFWLQFETKPRKRQRQPAATGTSATQEVPDTPTQVELKLAWTVRRSGAWTPRETAPQTLVHPWARPATAYSLKPRYHFDENQLSLDVYVTMTPDFNGQPFWNPYTGARKAQARDFDSAARPWHSSSFVFDGHVIGIRLKALNGIYQLDADTTRTNSFDFVRTLADPDGKLQQLQGGKQVSARVVVSDGMRMVSGRMVNNTWTGNSGSLTVLCNGQSVTLLTAAPAPFAATHSLHRIQPDTAIDRSPFIYTDPKRSYFVTSQWVDVAIDSRTTAQRLQYTFKPFSDPYAGLFVRELNRSGVEGLLNRAIQRFPETYPPGDNFRFDSYRPVNGITITDPTATTDVVDFSSSGANSKYHWETFFFAPFEIACRLADKLDYEHAIDWFHRIFDPANTEGGDVPQRFWVTKPFFEATSADAMKERIESILSRTSDPDVIAQLTQWRNHPFQPDVIARLRPVAYQKAVLMRYLEALIGWGDQQVLLATTEGNYRASLFYVLAAELLGRRPEHVPMVPREGQSYDDLTTQAALDPLGNQQVEVQVENLAERPTMVVASDAQVLPVVNLSYFSIPPNQDLLAYWDLVADRLWKVRHCMDLAGNVRQLPLFQPPIDPTLLVQAAAAGVDLDTVVGPAVAPGLPYRYSTVFSAAMAAASELRAMGESMLAALQHRDDAAYERLRAGNDTALESLVRRVRQDQVLEAQRAREALEQSREAVQARIDHYSAQPYMNDLETAATVVHAVAIASQVVSTVLNTVGGGASLVPKFEVGASGFGGSPVVTATYGGDNVASSVGMFAHAAEGLSGILHSTGSLLETQGGYQRRYDENQHQADVARKELAQVDKQVIAAQVREAVAQHELDAHDRTVDNAKSVEEFLRSKYTGEELYEWMVAQLSSVYLQAYQLAFDLARRAEAAYRFEVGDATSAPIISSGSWDSLKQGLLAGDRLVNDLRRLEITAYERNRRRLQATTHISLAALMPDKLLELKATGTTSIEISEWILARENPGWINQRLVSIAVTAPCVTGPYSGFHGGLTLTSAVVRTNDDVTGGFGDAFGSDPRFAVAMPAVTSIRISHGLNDKGRVPGSRADDRYDAFEGGGAICRLTVTAHQADNAFDMVSLTDLVLTLEYEGDQGSKGLTDLARDAVADALPKKGALLLWLDGTYGAAWSRFLHPATGEQVLKVDLDTSALPYLYQRLAQHRRLVVSRADVLLDADTSPLTVRVTPPDGDTIEVVAPSEEGLNGWNHASASWDPSAPESQNLIGTWQIQIRRDTDQDWGSLPENTVAHSWLLLRFQASDA